MNKLICSGVTTQGNGDRIHPRKEFKYPKSGQIDKVCEQSKNNVSEIYSF